MRLVVDGQECEVRQRVRQPGVYDFTWTSRPNPGYGFMSATPDHTVMTVEQLTAAIVNFLTQVDPATGHIKD